MGIEKEIGQTIQFKSEIHKVAVNILFTASWLQLKNAEALKSYDLTPQQFNILRILRGQHPNPASVNLLMQRMLDKSSNASRLVDRLEEKGFASRTTNTKDKRAVDVSITPKGMEILKQIDDNIGLLEYHLKSITEAEAKQLNDLLDQLRGK
jgi:DNA-binding MarR family transcriptional regulator